VVEVVELLKIYLQQLMEQEALVVEEEVEILVVLLEQFQVYQEQLILEVVEVELHQAVLVVQVVQESL
jgi:hypothetical protein